MPEHFGIIICPTRCYECMFGECYDPPTPHTWGAVDDFEHAAATGQPPPGNCGCPCARLTPEQEAALAPQVAQMLEGAEERRKQPARPDDIDKIKRRLAQHAAKTDRTGDGS